MCAVVNWGSSTQAQIYRQALSGVQQLVHTQEHVKNYQPQILILTGPPSSRPALVDFAYLICKMSSLLVCGNVVNVLQSCIFLVYHVFSCFLVYF